ncbi:MAG: peptidase, partial [Chlamydiae bacterium]|nr:peptidase [Chlamydiota bacterium]
MESFFYALLAILGLGFLVFIHELGHFWIARREGMRVEAFSIGFGKPIYTWEHNGVKWMICILPFGGYVRIAGMQKEGSREPYEIADGFFGKKPWQRIKVALAGPLVNIAFALIAFTMLWAWGGRVKSFSEFTHRIGLVDPEAPLYQLGVRAGDVIEKYDNHSFNGFKDLLIASLMSEKTARIEGTKINYLTGKRTPFDYTLNTYEQNTFSKERYHTVGILSPASYLIFDGNRDAFSMTKISGVLPGDRILWADGEILFSVQQLSNLTNSSTAFLTVERGKEIFHTKVPRVQINDLKMTNTERAEISDWQYEAKIKGKLQDLYFIPYNLSPNGTVEGTFPFLDAKDQEEATKTCQKCTFFSPLVEGDRILAIDGTLFQSTSQFLETLQTRRSLLIVERNPRSIDRISWKQADLQFEDFNPAALSSLIASIGTSTPFEEKGSLHLLRPIVPKSRSELILSKEQKTEHATIQKEIESIKDSAKKTEALKQFELSQKRLVLGLPLRDREVIYNPNPISQFQAVVVDTWRTLKGLVSGYLNPKYMSGPVGIVHVVHQSWMVGVKEALFWMGVISLNLGIVNLLPIPVLDG